MGGRFAGVRGAQGVGALLLEGALSGGAGVLGLGEGLFVGPCGYSLSRLVNVWASMKDRLLTMTRVLGLFRLQTRLL